jgi:Spy/CpxP family protein refolding chaperone
VFALGALAGIQGTRLFLKYKVGKFIRGGPPGGMILRTISNELDLTDGQRAEIREIVADTEGKFMDFERKYHPEFTRILDEGIELIKGHLTEQQKRDLDLLFEKMEHRMFEGAVRMGVREDEITRNILLEEKGLLNLTQNQEAQILGVLEEGMRRRDDIVAKYRGKPPREMPPFMERMRDCDEAIQKDLRSILTAEQTSKYERLREERREKMMGPHHPRGPE